MKQTLADKHFSENKTSKANDYVSENQRMYVKLNRVNEEFDLSEYNWLKSMVKSKRNAA